MSPSRPRFARAPEAAKARNRRSRAERSRRTESRSRADPDHSERAQTAANRVDEALGGQRLCDRLRRAPRSRGQHLNSPVQEQPGMLEKDFGVLGLGSVAGIRIHHELGIWQVLGQQEGVDREDDDVFAPMHNQGSLANPS